MGHRIVAWGGGAGGLRREGALFGRGLLALRWGGFVFGHVGSMLRSLGSVFRRATLVFGRLDSLFGRLDYVRFCLSGYGSCGRQDGFSITPDLFRWERGNVRSRRGLGGGLGGRTCCRFGSR